MSNDLAFSRWHSQVKAYPYTMGRIGYVPVLMRPWFDEGMTPEQGFQRFKQMDQEAYKTWLANINLQAVRYQGLTKTALSRFIVWSTSRYNEYKKSEVVDIALEILATGKDTRTNKSILIFSCGAYTENTGGNGGDYLVHGEEHYIASGYGTRIETFREEQRLHFPLVAGGTQ